jgi:pimeloyl-ACP methyl ester carboxylesterase
MPLARVGEIELSYERAGDGSPLLAIMGMSGTFDHWHELFLDGLRQELDVVVYDHRGVGSSSPLHGGAPLTIAGMAQDAVGLLDALEIDRAHVLGISMGGMVAQQLALAHPERVHALTLGCTYCGGEGSALTHEQTLRKLMEGAVSGDRAIAVRAAWEANVSPDFAADERQYARFLEIGLRRAVAMDVVMAQMRAIAGHDTSPRLPELCAPTLVVHGTLDEMLPVQNGHQIAGLIPGSRLEVLDGVGHLFFWEQPERSAELIRGHAAVHA